MTLSDIEIFNDTRVYIADRNYSIQCELTLMLDAGIEASACTRTATSTVYNHRAVSPR